jgi:hypothetical protein
MDRPELTRGRRLLGRLRLDWFWARVVLACPWVSQRRYRMAIEEADFNGRQVLHLSKALDAEKLEAEMARAFAKDAYSQLTAARKAIEAARVGAVN